MALVGRYGVKPRKGFGQVGRVRPATNDRVNSNHFVPPTPRRIGQRDDAASNLDGFDKAALIWMGVLSGGFSVCQRVLTGVLQSVRSAIALTAWA